MCTSGCVEDLLCGGRWVKVQFDIIVYTFFGHKTNVISALPWSSDVKQGLAHGLQEIKDLEERKGAV